MARLHGADAVRGAIEGAVAATLFNGPARKRDERAKVEVELVQASAIRPEPISWIWFGHLARGKLHILAGKPAAGKTTLAVAMAAIISNGGIFPDGTKCAIGRVVIWSGEDSPADTLVPRLIAAGANLDNVIFVAGAIEGEEAVPFNPSKHMVALSERLLALGDVSLLLIDPVVSAIAGDSHKNAEVRHALQPLADLGAKYNCAVLGITHFTKGTGGRDPVERLTGSLAFGAVARIVLVAAKSEDNSEDTNEPGRRLMLRAKSNIGPDGGGFEYDLEQLALPDHADIKASAVKWGPAVEGSARELLAEAEACDGEDSNHVTTAAEWLGILLVNGPVEQPTIKATARQAGHAWATVRRAKQRLGIKACK
jgi:putative DNA primase/helicase